MAIKPALILAVLLSALGHAGGALAQVCHREGSAVTCDDGRRGELSGDAIIWSDGTSSRSSPHPSVIVGNKSSVHVGAGVFVGKGKGVVPLDDRTRRTRRAAPSSMAFHIVIEICP